MDPMRRASGCLFGMALGDALGAKTEFLSLEAIRRQFPPNGPTEPKGNPAQVTDDSQMALAVAESLMAAPKPYSPETLEPIMRQAFLAWWMDPENDRAPGMTCLNACAALSNPIPWQKATIAGSKGCGANMRVQSVGLLGTEDDGVTEQTRSAIAQFQAAMTHGHPTALAAADLTAAAIADLHNGGDPEGLLGRLREYAQSQRFVYHEEWLGSLWQRPGIDSPEEFIMRGWDECLEVLDNLDAAVAAADRETDPCVATGDGWVAEEAFATGLLCFLLFPDDGPAAIRRAALTIGDSDSIACLTGAFAGAHLGLSAWPQEWLERIEYRERLVKLGDFWDN